MTFSWRVIRAAPAALLLMSPLVGARAETITVTHWGAPFYGAPYAVAMEKGFFKKAGIDITGILTSAGGGTSVRNTLAGDLPFGEVALPAALMAINSGQPLKIIGGGVESIARHPLDHAAGFADLPIKDIVGKKVGFTSPGSVTNMLILMCLKAAGIDRKRRTICSRGRHRREPFGGAQQGGRRRHDRRAGVVGEQAKVKPAFWTKDASRPR